MNHRFATIMTIEVFTTTTCPHCEAAKQYLSEKGFNYTVKNVQEDKAFRHELISKGFKGVPVIIIDGVNIVGFDKEKIKQILNI